MPVFPSVRTLIVPPSQWWSRDAVASLVSGEVASGYSPAALTDGSVWPTCKTQYGTGRMRVNLGAAREANILGVFGHNFDEGSVLGTSNEAGLLRGFGARDPNCWLDLRGFLTTAQYWDVFFSEQSRGGTIAEIVVATGFEFEGVLLAPLDEQIRYWQERDQTEYGKSYIAASGSMTRTMPLRMRLTPDDQGLFAQVVDEASIQGARIVMVPDTRRNDIWLAEWPDSRSFRYAASYREADVEFLLIDQSPGVRA